jgi:hypothetical protein
MAMEHFCLDTRIAFTCHSLSILYTTYAGGDDFGKPNGQFGCHSIHTNTTIERTVGTTLSNAPS